MFNLRLAFRTLFKTPFVTIVAVLSLALGIGANAAIFSLFDQMLLRPLPVHAPDRLVNLAAPGPHQGSTSCSEAGSCEAVFSYPMFRDLEAERTGLTHRGASRLPGQCCVSQPDDERRGHARLGIVFPGAWPGARARSAAHAQ